MGEKIGAARYLQRKQVQLAVVVPPPVLHHTRVRARDCFDQNHAPTRGCQRMPNILTHFFGDEGYCCRVWQAAVRHYAVPGDRNQGARESGQSRRVKKKKEGKDAQKEGKSGGGKDSQQDQRSLQVRVRRDERDHSPAVVTGIGFARLLSGWRGCSSVAAC